MVGIEKKGWHPDPFGIHAERYFYADGEPGRLVRDEKRNEFYDDIPPQLVPPRNPSDDRAAVAHSPGPTTAGADVEASDKTVVPMRQELDDPIVMPSELLPDFHYPEDPVRLRTAVSLRLTALAHKMGRVRPPKASKRTWLAAGMIVLACVILAGFVAILTSDLSPSPTRPVHSVRTESTLPPNPSATTAVPAFSTATTGWSENHAFPASSLTLDGIACPTSEACFAVGETTVKTGMVLSTRNDGITWQQQMVPDGVSVLRAVSCISITVCVAVGGTSVITTLNGGVTWGAQSLGSGSLYAVTCIAPFECVVAGENVPAASRCHSGSTFTSLNGGQTWTTTALDCFVPAGIACATSSRCELVGSQYNGAEQIGEILGTADAGRHWQRQYTLSRTNTRLNGVACPSTLVCEAVGNSPTEAIVGTVDGGRTWVKQPVPESTSEQYFLTASCGSPLACNAGSTAPPVTTSDGGHSWTVLEPVAAAVTMNGIVCPTVLECVAVADTAGSGGITLQFSD